SLTPLDIEVLSLLYEPVVPANYSRELFERDFGDELYNVNYHQKIKNLLDSTPSVSCDDMEKSFLGDIFLKHPKEINLYVYGQIRQDDSLTIKSAILALNQISPNINISTAPSPVIEPT